MVLSALCVSVVLGVLVIISFVLRGPGFFCFYSLCVLHILCFVIIFIFYISECVFAFLIYVL